MTQGRRDRSGDSVHQPSRPPDRSSDEQQPISRAHQLSRARRATCNTNPQGPGRSTAGAFLFSEQDIPRKVVTKQRSRIIRMGLVWTTSSPLALCSRSGAYTGILVRSFRQPGGLPGLLGAVVVGWSWLTIGMEWLGAAWFPRLRGIARVVRGRISRWDSVAGQRDDSRKNEQPGPWKPVPWRLEEGCGAPRSRRTGRPSLIWGRPLSFTG